MKILPLLVLVLLPGSAIAQTVESLRESGPTGNRINLVFLGDGYTQAEQDKLASDARKLVDDFFTVNPLSVPYATYANLFNVKLVHAISAESGADHPSIGIFRDTAFDAAYDCGGIARLICADDQKVLSAAAAAVPEVDVAVLVVNDPTYGGSGGEVAVLSTHPQSLRILQHELTHTMGKVADEYEAPAAYPPCDPVQDCVEPNVTLRTDRGEIKWSPWIDASTPLPTPPTFAGVGLFEGARYLSTGVYRPQSDCTMRSLSAPFCTVCSEALVAAFYDRVSPLDSGTPDQPVALAWGATSKLAVTHPDIASMRVSWSVDGKVVPGESGDAFEVGAASLGTGVHIIKAHVGDDTPLLRPDLLVHASAEAGFRVDASAGTCGDGVVNGPEACDDGNTAPGDGCSASCQQEPRPVAVAPAHLVHKGCSASGGAPGLLGLVLAWWWSRRR